MPEEYHHDVGKDCREGETPALIDLGFDVCREIHSLEPNYMVSFCLPHHRHSLYRSLDWIPHFHCKRTVASRRHAMC